MTPERLLQLSLAVPFCVAVLVLLTGSRPNLRESVSLLGGAALFAVVSMLFLAVAGGERPSMTLAEPLPGLAIHFVLEPLGAMFAGLASFLWIVTTIYAIGYMRGHGETHQTRFYACFAIAILAVMGAAAAGNLLTLFVFYELLTISTYPLVTHSGSENAKRAGRVYLGILISTSIGLLLPAIVWTHSIAGSTDFTAGGLLQDELASGALGRGAAMVLFALFAFGIGKAALMPFHRWLPAAMVAPTPVSALLHAVAVVKTGVFAILKIVVYVFGVDALAVAGAAEPIAWVAGFTMLVASIVALSRDNLKERLAWSTIGQLSYIVAGACTATAAGVVGASLHMITHAFGKITLFFAAGAALVTAHVTTVSGSRGLGRAMPFTFAAFALAAMSIVGLPPMGGMWSKFWLGQGMSDADRPLLLLVLLGSSLLSAAYLLPVALRAFASPPAQDPTPPRHDGAGDVHRPGHELHDADDPFDPHLRSEAPWPCRVAMGITVAGCVVLFFQLDSLAEMLEPILR
jgi:multicomponent Na+:H+ antiporter subunit D